MSFSRVPYVVAGEDMFPFAQRDVGALHGSLRARLDVNLGFLTATPAAPVLRIRISLSLVFEIVQFLTYCDTLRCMLYTHESNPVHNCVPHFCGYLTLRDAKPCPDLASLGTLHTKVAHSLFFQSA